jgi:hypothetical protein
VIGPLGIVASLAFTLVEPTLPPPREVEFPFDDARRLNPGETHAGKAWRSPGLANDGRAAPLVVFVHGIIFDGQRHHWLTTDRNGPWDARPFMTDLVEHGAIPPLVVAVPSQTRDAHDPSKLFVGLDFDAFVDAVDRAIAPHQRVDRGRVIVVGNSAAACDPDNAALAATRARTFTPRALLAVDGCMAASAARALSAAKHDVIVTYQEDVWPERPFAEFRKAFLADPQHVLERITVKSPNPHLALVEETVRRYLPKLLR